MYARVLAENVMFDLFLTINRKGCAKIFRLWTIQLLPSYLEA